MLQQLLSSVSLSDVYRFAVAIALLLFIRYLGVKARASSLSTRLGVAAVRKRTSRDKKRVEHIQFLSASKSSSSSSECHFPPFNFTPSRIQQLLQLSASEIASSIKDGSLKSEEVVSLYCSCALQTDQHTRAVTEEVYREAVLTAQQIDNALQKPSDSNSTSRKLLLGVPISVKDQFDQLGTDSTMGMACRVFQLRATDGLLVELLRDAGAIPFVRTNVPQLLMLPESDNKVWGCCLNPWNKDRTAGGSSGGEAALLASHGSILGIGTDIGGSIRIPSHFCGVYGFKPTPKRVTLQGLAVPRYKNQPGQHAILPTPGPMGRHVEDLTLIMRAWLVEKMWTRDPYIPRLPWRQSAYDDFANRKLSTSSSSSSSSSPSSSSSTPLRIGYYVDDGFFTPAPACQRAVLETVEALRSAGHTLIPFSPPNVSKAVRLYYGVMAADGGEGFVRALEGEELNSMYSKLLMAAQLPNWVRPLLSFVMERAGQPRLSLLTSSTASRSADQFWAIESERDDYLRDFWNVWDKDQLDAVICPAVALPAYNHGGATDLTASCSYTMLFNILHNSAGVVPITTVRDDEQNYKSTINDIYTSKAAEVCKKSAGLPVAVQVATKPFQDEECLGLMRLIEQLIPFNHVSPVATTLRASEMKWFS